MTDKLQRGQGGTLWASEHRSSCRNGYARPPLSRLSATAGEPSPIRYTLSASRARRARLRAVSCSPSSRRWLTDLTLSWPSPRCPATPPGPPPTLRKSILERRRKTEIEAARRLKKKKIASQRALRQYSAAGARSPPLPVCCARSCRRQLSPPSHYPPAALSPSHRSGAVPSGAVHTAGPCTLRPRGETRRHGGSQRRDEQARHRIFAKYLISIPSQSASRLSARPQSPPTAGGVGRGGCRGLACERAIRPARARLIRRPHQDSE